MTDTYTYDAFGAVKSRTGTSANPYRFTGELQDYQVARQPLYLRARYYDPALGRFLSRDPLSGFAVSPQSLNRYLYALDNPVILIDPTGLQCLGDFCFPLIGPVNWSGVNESLGDVIGCGTDSDCLARLAVDADAAAAALASYRAVATNALTAVGCMFAGTPGCLLGKFGGELATAPVTFTSNVFSGAGTLAGCAAGFMRDPKEGGGMNRGNVSNCAASFALTAAGFIRKRISTQSLLTISYAGIWGSAGL